MSRADAQARAVYESWHERVQRETATADRPWHELVFAHLGAADLGGRDVLEIGCGRGELSCETIEHLSDPVQALREFHRVLRPGGRLILTTPNYFGPFGLYRAYLRLR